LSTFENGEDSYIIYMYREIIANNIERKRLMLSGFERLKEAFSSSDKEELVSVNLDLGKCKLIPVLKIKEITPEDAVRCAEVLIENGIIAMEIMFRRHSDSIAIKSIAKEFPDFYIGAGGVLNSDQLLRVVDSNARFATAPGVDMHTLREANRNKIMFAPGVTTPTNLQMILRTGLLDFQFFPAEQAGGAAFIEAMMSPFEHLPIDVFPKGGITIEKISEYLKLDHVRCVFVDDIITVEDIENKNFEAIGLRAKKAVEAAG